MGERAEGGALNTQGSDMAGGTTPPPGSLDRLRVETRQSAQDKKSPRVQDENRYDDISSRVGEITRSQNKHWHFTAVYADDIHKWQTGQSDRTARQKTILDSTSDQRLQDGIAVPTVQDLAQLLAPPPRHFPFTEMLSSGDEGRSAAFLVRRVSGKKCSSGSSSSLLSLA